MENAKKNFRLIVISQVINLIGATMLRFTLSLYILDITGSAEIFGTIIAISFIPTIILTPFGGAIADRFSKKSLMVIIDSINTLLAGSLVFLLFNGLDSILAIGIVITLLSAVSTFYHPVVTASLPSILKEDELMKANGIVQGVNALSDFIAPVLAGILYGPIGVSNIVMIGTICFLFSTSINVFIKIPHEKRESSYGIFKTILLDLKEGFVYISKEEPVLLKLSLILSVIAMLFNSAFTVAMPYVIRIVFGMSEEFFAFTQSGIGVAMILGSIIVGLERMQKWLGIKNIPMWIGLIGVISLSLGVSLLPWLINDENNLGAYLVFTAGFILLMCIFAIVSIIIMVTVQGKVPIHLVGKIISIIMAVGGLATPLGQLILGFLLEIFAGQLYVIFFGISILTILIGLVVGKKKWLG